MTRAAELISALRARCWTLGVAESLTGGAVTSALVSVPGASTVLFGGVIAYATPVKARLLGVDPALLSAHGPVHPEVARQMAAGVRFAVQVDGRVADVGIATTGIAGPDSPDGQPVGTVHVAVVTPARSETRSFALTGDRADIRRQAVDAAIEMAVLAVGE